MAKVFISYSRKDITFAKMLTAELQKCEMDFWIDWEGIPPTVDWWREIEKGIEEADIFLFLISPDSSGSKVCGQEIDTAVRNAKRIIPLLVRDIKGEDIPKSLSHLNWIFFRESDDFGSSLQKLLAAIQTDYEWAATHRRLQVKALDWERNKKEDGFLLRGMDLLDAEQDLASNTSKDPHPTDLQREYVLASRRATDRQRRIITSISLAGLIVLAGLAVFGFHQAGVANENLAVAQTAQADAINRAAIAQGLQLGSQSQSLFSSLQPIEAFRLRYVAENALKQVSNAGLSLDLVKALGADTLFAVSPDGRYLATVLDRKIIVWDTSNLVQDPLVLEGHKDKIIGLTFSPDGKIVASTSWDHTVRLWNLENRVPRVLPLEGEDGYATSLAFTPDGRFLVTGSYDTTLRMWNMANPAETKPIRIQNQAGILDLSISRDGNVIAVAARDNTIHLYPTDPDLLPREGVSQVLNLQYYNLSGHEFIRDLAFSPDGLQLAVITTTYIRLYDITYDQKSGLANTLTAPRLEAEAPAELAELFFSPDGQQIAVGTRDGEVQIWNVNTLNEPAMVISTVDDFAKIDWLR